MSLNDLQEARLLAELDQAKTERDQAVHEGMQLAGQVRRHQLAITAIRALCAEAEHGRHRRDAAVAVTDIRDALEDHL